MCDFYYCRTDTRYVSKETQNTLLEEVRGCGGQGMCDTENKNKYQIFSQVSSTDMLTWKITDSLLSLCAGKLFWSVQLSLLIRLWSGCWVPQPDFHGA